MVKKTDKIAVNPFTLLSFKGVDTGESLFELGKTFKQINAKHGEAIEVMQNNILKMTFETRQACQLKYKNDKLVAIICSKHTTPLFNGLNLFDPASIEKLKSEHDCIDGKAYITFPTLGICIGGMAKKRIPEGKVAIVFVPEETDTYTFFANED